MSLDDSTLEKLRADLRSELDRQVTAHREYLEALYTKTLSVTKLGIGIVAGLAAIVIGFLGYNQFVGIGQQVDGVVRQSIDERLGDQLQSAREDMDRYVQQTRLLHDSSTLELMTLPELFELFDEYHRLYENSTADMRTGYLVILRKLPLQIEDTLPASTPSAAEAQLIERGLARVLTFAPEDESHVGAEIRRKAIALLCQLNTDDAVLIAQNHLGQETDLAVRIPGIKSLGQTRRSEVLESLRGSYSTQAPEIQVAITQVLAATESLSPTGSGPAPSDLILRGDTFPEVITQGQDVLLIERAHVRDNGEGDSFRHGPYGRLWVAVFGNDEMTELLARLPLAGPHQTGSATWEWLDNDEVRYEEYGIWRWGESTHSRIMLQVYESDPGPFRGYDTLLLAPVSRASTTDAAVVLETEAITLVLRTRDL